ncbi:unnamed protein product [Prunus armeniaca]
MQTGTPSSPSTPAAAVPRVAAPPSVRAAVATSTAAPTPRAPAVVGAQKTSAHRTLPPAPPARPIAAVAPGRKRPQTLGSEQLMPRRPKVLPLRRRC